jgi:hypothetical protein
LRGKGTAVLWVYWVCMLTSLAIGILLFAKCVGGKFVSTNPITVAFYSSIIASLIWYLIRKRLLMSRERLLIASISIGFAAALGGWIAYELL